MSSNNSEPRSTSGSPPMAESSAQGDPGSANAGPSSEWELDAVGRPSRQSMILRRREANRLAAQRFRNRKKGYQDSLEERVRVLEEERAVLMRRVGEGEDWGVRREEEDYFSRHHHGSSSGSSSTHHSSSYPYPRLPERLSPNSGADSDLRMASLESANRRLQDELKMMSQENSRLRSTVDKWIEWERRMRVSSSSGEPSPTTSAAPTRDTSQAIHHYPAHQRSTSTGRLHMPMERTISGPRISPPMPGVPMRYSAHGPSPPRSLPAPLSGERDLAYYHSTSPLNSTELAPIRLPSISRSGQPTSLPLAGSSGHLPSHGGRLPPPPYQGTPPHHSPPDWSVRRPGPMPKQGDYHRR